MNNGRDCEHGRQVGKCADCEVIELEKKMKQASSQAQQIAMRTNDSDILILANQIQSLLK